MLKEDMNLHPYKARLLHELSDEDFAHRVAFCEEVQERMDYDHGFINNLIFTDGANFHLCGDVNRHNLRYWSNDNPNVIFTKPMHSPRVTVWAGVWAGGFLGPFFFQRHSNRRALLEHVQQ